MNPEEAIERCKKGERSAQAWLYETYAPRLLAACRRIVGDERTAEDLLHDGFIIILSQIGTLRDAAFTEAWMNRIVTNLALRYVKRRRETVGTDGMETVCQEDDEDKEDSLPTFDEIMDMVDRLPSGYREVFRLSVLDGLPHGEIAAILGIEPRSSSSQLARAKRSLRKMINEYRRRIGVTALLLAAAITATMLYTDRDKTAVIPTIKPRKMAPGGLNDYGHTAHEATEMPMPTGMYIREHAAMPTDTAADTATRNMTDTPEPAIIPNPATALTRIDDIINTPITYVPDTLLMADAAVSTDNGRQGGGKGWGLSLRSAAETSSSGMAARVLSIISHTVEGGTRVNIESWEELSHYLTYDVGDELPPEERDALLRIALVNDGRIITHKSFDKPVQFGLDFGKRMTDRLSLDFGLRLTRHTTNLTTGNSDTTSIMERQRSYFIGVPVNMTYSFMKHGRWSLYGTAGMAIDIPFHGTADIRYKLDNATIYRRPRRLELPAWQWSVNIGAGVSYDIAPGLQLFFSPRLTWYIPNGSRTETQWSDKPWQVSTPFGLRLMLK